MILQRSGFYFLNFVVCGWRLFLVEKMLLSSNLREVSGRKSDLVIVCTFGKSKLNVLSKLLTSERVCQNLIKFNCLVLTKHLDRLRSDIAFHRIQTIRHWSLIHSSPTVSSQWWRGTFDTGRLSCSIPERLPIWRLFIILWIFFFYFTQNDNIFNILDILCETMGMIAIIIRPRLLLEVVLQKFLLGQIV